MTDGPLLWFLNRGTGIVLVAVLTLTVLLGVLSTRGAAGARIPRFLLQTVHRTVSLLALTLLTVHVATAVADTYVDIRWWQAVLPFGSAYQPFWLALGTLSLDVMLAVVVTSLMRERLGHRSWRIVHV